MVDQEFLKSIFAGDNSAFQRFYGECRALFMAYFAKHYPGTKVNITDLYQEAIIQLWANITDRKITEDGFTTERGLFSYVIEIGIRKLSEESRNISKYEKLKKGLRVYKKRTTKTTEPEEGVDNEKEFPLQSRTQQIEVERMTMINETAYFLYNKQQVDPYQDSDEYAERLREWSEFLKLKYEELGYPCNQLLRYTWYKNLTDSDIVKAFNGYFANANVVKTKRYKCHKTLLNMYHTWKSLNN